jgi:uncharacterized RDD family membrane protein YckC
MDENLSVTEDSPKGYLSETNKRTFTITAGVLGALFFFGQLFVPFLAMLIFMPVFFASMWHMKYADMNRAVFWEDSIWYIEGEGTSESYQRGPKFLMRLNPFKDKKASIADTLSFEDPWLLIKDNQLWIISPESVGRFLDGKITQIIDNMRLGSISKPFVYQGRIAVIESQPGGFFLRTYSVGSWTKPMKVNLPSSMADSSFLTDLHIVAIEDRVFLFAEFKGVIFLRKGIQRDDDSTDVPWTPITNAKRWSVIAHKDEPILFICLSEGMKDKIFAMREIDGEWNTFMTHEVSLPLYNTTFLPFSDNYEFLMVDYAFTGGFKATILNEDKAEQILKFGRTSPFPPSFILMMVIPYSAQLILPVVLALILSALMKKHRISRYETRGKQAILAPLSLRVFSQMVDALILGFPIIIGYIFFFMGFLRIDFFVGPFFPFAFFGMFILGFIWAIVGVVIFSYFEGRWGITPGKRIFRIRVVGSDLEFCGFGRAFIRNILKFVDGFFNFMVGIMLIALTTNWQRVGDLAARTIVIKKPTND